MRLQGKVAIVTGGARGIGAAIARRFVREGACAVIVDRELEADAEPCFSIEADISDLDTHERVVNEVTGRLGHIDILVNNAGIQIREPFLEAQPASWDRVFSTNLKGPYFLSQRIARRMPDGGRIVNIASVHDVKPHVGNSIYCLTKAGLKMMTKCLALELAGQGIRVNAISPGAIATDINRDVLSNQEFSQQLATNIPMGRIGSVEDIAGAAVYLSSQDSDYVTGATCYVDGGLLLR